MYVHGNKEEERKKPLNYLFGCLNECYFKIFGVNFVLLFVIRAAFNLTNKPVRVWPFLFSFSPKNKSYKFISMISIQTIEQ